MTRPRQWKDKASLTDAEVEELKQLVAALRRSGRRRDLRQLHPADARRPRQGLVRRRSPTTRAPATTTSSGWPIASGTTARRSSSTRPTASSRRSRPRPRRGARRRARRVRTRGPADGPEDRPLSERCISYGAPRTGANYNSYVQIIQSPQTTVLLQEMIHDARVVPMTGTAAPAGPHPPAARRSARPLGRRHAGGRDHQLHQRLPGIDARRDADRALHPRQPGLHQLGDHGRATRRPGPGRTPS